MRQEDYDKRMGKLREAIEQFSPGPDRERLEQLYAETEQRHREIQEAARLRQLNQQKLHGSLKELKKSLQAAADGLGDLSLLATYLRFDLEARRREAGQGPPT